MDRSIKLFDIRTHKLIQHYGDAHGPSSVQSSIEGSPGFSGGVNSISFGGRNGEWLISTGMDGLVKVWDVKEGHLFYTLHGHKNGPTTNAVFSPKGDFFATGGSDSQVMVWKSNFDSLESGDDDFITAKGDVATNVTSNGKVSSGNGNVIKNGTGLSSIPPQKHSQRPASKATSDYATLKNSEPIQIGAPIVSSVVLQITDAREWTGMKVNLLLKVNFKSKKCQTK